MTKHYHVMVSRGSQIFSREKRARSDAALYLFRRTVYECIKANAGLDTKWGHEAMHQANAHNDARVECTVVMPTETVYLWRD